MHNVITHISLPATGAPAAPDPASSGFATVRREASIEKPGASGPESEAPASANVVVTQLDEQRVAERIDELVIQAAEIHDPTMRSRLIDGLDRLQQQYVELDATLEQLSGPEGRSTVDATGETSSASPSATTGETPDATPRDPFPGMKQWDAHQRELLALQLRAHQLIRNVETISKTVEHSVTGAKTMFQTNV